MKIALFQLDGKIPNIALMRLAHHHRNLGDDIQFRWTGSPQREFGDCFDRVYGSAIFSKSMRSVEMLLCEFPGAIVGGTGVNLESSIEQYGITTKYQDYSIYPKWRQSIGFTQRGCRLKCSFCVVPKKEGSIRAEKTISEIWRGEPFPRELLLLDNDFFGNPNYRSLIAEIREHKFKVSFNQGINARFLTDESAEAIASVDYRDDSMKNRRIYTAWDNKKDERLLFNGLEKLVKYGVKPRHIMVYMLVGYWPGEKIEDCLYRQKKLRDFGCLPYPMPFTRTVEMCGFQRWVIGAYDKKISWTDWKNANYQPRYLLRPHPEFDLNERTNES